MRFFSLLLPSFFTVSSPRTSSRRSCRRTTPYKLFFLLIFFPFPRNFRFALEPLNPLSPVIELFMHLILLVTFSCCFRSGTLREIWLICFIFFLGTRKTEFLFPSFCEIMFFICGSILTLLLVDPDLPLLIVFFLNFFGLQFDLYNLVCILVGLS